MHRLRVPSLVMLAVVAACTATQAPAPAKTPAPAVPPATSSPAAGTPPPALPAASTAPTSALPSAPAPNGQAATPVPHVAAPSAPQKVVAAPPAPQPRPAPVAAAPAPPAAAPKPAAPPLDLTSLEQRLRETRAIGVFTKLSLKNQVDALLEQFRAKHKGASIPTLAELRQRYDLLLLKVLSLLQDDDPTLAQAITTSREAIWGILSDPREFAKI